MQGRLLPKYKGRYQAHPVNYWVEEFKIAEKLGLDCIEFILDFDEFHLNPLSNAQGVEEIKKVSDSSGIGVNSICADYFMESPLHSSDTAISEKSKEVLKALIKASNLLGVENIVIPCVDQSSLKSKAEKDLFIKSIIDVVPLAEENKINLSLETDLAPKPFRRLLNDIDASCVKVNYDIGNSAGLGFNLVEELDQYGHHISDIHIKDRLLNGQSVFLGQGSANFELFFDTLLQYKYEGIFIMQAYRDEEGVKIFKEQLNFIKPFLKEFNVS